MYRKQNKRVFTKSLVLEFLFLLQKGFKKGNFQDEAWWPRDDNAGNVVINKVEERGEERGLASHTQCVYCEE